MPDEDARSLTMKMGTIAMQAGVRDEDELADAIRIAYIAKYRIQVALSAIAEGRTGLAVRVLESVIK